MGDKPVVFSYQKYEELREQYEELRERTRWSPVSERTPTEEELGDDGVIATLEGTESFVTYHSGVVTDAWFEDGEWYIEGCRLREAKVLAWMPLPEAYKGTKC